jgi:uncharacterized damage-inducible protein DinB
MTTIILVCALLLVSPFPVMGGDLPDTKPVKGFIGDYLGQMNDAETQLLSLEGAIPAEKFTWRPADGVRSISEVYLHVAFGNYLLLKFCGIEPPADVNVSVTPKEWEASTTDKTAIATILKNSFAHVRTSLSTMNPDRLETMVEFFGRNMTTRYMMLTALSHVQEHLGQSIAYARMNGVAPPWTAARQAAAKEQK